VSRHFLALLEFLNGIICLHRQPHHKFFPEIKQSLSSNYLYFSVPVPTGKQFKGSFEGVGMSRKVDYRHFCLLSKIRYQKET